VDQLAQSVNFEYLLESNQTLLTKENLFLMTFLQVCKFTKIIEIRNYLFQGSKQSYSTRFSDLS
jgi:hypothetical protein